MPPPFRLSSKEIRASRCRARGPSFRWGPEGWGDDIAYGVFITVSLALATLPVGLLIGFFVALAKQSRRTVAPACRQHLHDDLSRPARTADAVHRLLRRADRAAEARPACRPDGHRRDQRLRRRHDRAGAGVLVLLRARSSCRPSGPSRKGQYEGGYAIGLTRGQTMRLVILPQLIRIALPGLVQPLADPARRTPRWSPPSACPTSCARPASPPASRRRPSCSIGLACADLPRAGDHLLLRHQRDRTHRATSAECSR